MGPDLNRSLAFSPHKALMILDDSQQNSNDISQLDATYMEPWSHGGVMAIQSIVHAQMCEHFLLLVSDENVLRQHWLSENNDISSC